MPNSCVCVFVCVLLFQLLKDPFQFLPGCCCVGRVVPMTPGQCVCVCMYGITVELKSACWLKSANRR